MLQPSNGGKGAALRRGFQEVTGDLVVIQDADLEYSPEEFPELIELICQGRADVVYGSRFLGRHRVFLFTHYAGNRFLTLVTNVLYNTMLTDMETCYKVMRTEVLRSMTLQSDGFGIEPELTAKIFKRALPRLRSADHVRRPRLRRRQEDHLARRVRRALGAAEIPVHRVNPLPRLLRLRPPVSRALCRGGRGDAGLRRRHGGRRRHSSSRSSTTSCPPARAALFGVRCALGSRSWRSTWSKGVGAYFSTYLMTDVGQRVVRDLRNQLFRHILDQSAGFFAHGPPAQLMSRITNDVGQVQQAVSETIGDLLREALSLVGYAALHVLLRLRGWRSSA